jgi:hypothetical protein
MNPTHFRTVFEHQQALARAGESAMTEADPQSLPPPPSTPEPTLVVSPSAHETSPSSSSTDEMTRQLLSVINSGAPSSPIAQRRSTRAKKPRARRTKSATVINKTRVGDIYGFMDVDDGSVNEM